MRCHNCGSDKTESDTSSGTSVCVNCGTVLEENVIVAEVTFGETAGGKAVLQGSYAGESGRISGGGLFGRNRGREGQEQAIENGRVKISSLAHAVRLPERYRDAAQRYYNLAVVNRFTRGRRSDHVAAVCLYAVCRTEKSSHMLIDFSDILQVNVFTLGATFLKLCRILNLTLPHVDPSLYISRFAVALDFGDYTQRVAQDAVRIAQRMDRDWITSGRRPAGICGACLLIAARMNGFRRTTREMIYVVKVADVTIQKRLQEFNQTESAQLSVRDFRTVWLENRADPPSFQKNRKIQALKEKEETESLQSAQSEDELQDSENEKENEVVIASRKRKGKGRADERPPKRRASLITRNNNGRRKAALISNDEDSEEEEDGDVDVEAEEEEEDDDPLKVSREEVSGPFVGHQKGLSEADNGAPGKGKSSSQQANGTTSKAESSKKKSEKTIEKETEEELIIRQIEASLNQEIKHVAHVNASLTAEATIKSKNNTQVDDEATQVATQFDDDLESTLVQEEEGLSTLVAEQENGDADYIPLKNYPYYDELPLQEKIRLTNLAKAKIAREENELLNPDLQKDTKEIRDDLEAWLHDDSIMEAAQAIEKQKHGDKKAGDDEDFEEEEEDDGNLSEVDDDEIEAMILNDDEVNLKTKIWYNANKQYLEEMAIRRMVEKDKGLGARGRKSSKKKKMPPPTSAAEAAKQMVVNKKLSKKINQAVFDDMFESAESIAKIKQRDVISRINGTSSAAAAIPEYEVVEEPGDIPDATATTKKTAGEGSTDKDETAAENPAAAEEEEDDEEMDSDDMADDERLLRDARAKYAFDDEEAPEYYSDNNDDDW